MIRLIAQPTVRLVGRQTIDAEAIDDFLRGEGVENWESSSSVAGQVLAEVAGRLCYKSFAKPRPGGNGGYLRHILEEGHGSILEHAVFNFIFSGVSRSFTHELVRHRAGFGYSQRSQRFCDENDAAVVVPPELEGEVAAGREFIRQVAGEEATARDVTTEMIEQGKPSAAARIGLNWLNAMELTNRVYGEIDRYLQKRHRFQIVGRSLDQKRAREAARSVLPNATETQIFVTANTRALRGMIEQRGVAGADREMRAVAVALARVLMTEVPNIVPDYRIESDADGVEFVGFEWRKV